jgi:RNA polymerase sigma-70 factor, ECF subfamily
MEQGEVELIAAARLAMASGSRLDPALQAAMNAMFAEHHRAVLRYCRYKQLERADDLAQEVMLVAYRKLPDFRGESSFRTWVLAIASRVCMRDRERRRDLLSEDGVVDDRDPTLSPLKALSREERLQIVRDAAARALRPIEQEAVELRYAHEMSREDMKRILELDSADQARVLLIRCRRRLKKAILAVLEERHHGLSMLVTTLSAV